MTETIEVVYKVVRTVDIEGITKTILGMRPYISLCTQPSIMS